jgi:hypothetical protein
VAQTCAKWSERFHDAKSNCPVLWHISSFSISITDAKDSPPNSTSHQGLPALVRLVLWIIKELLEK